MAITIRWGEELLDRVLGSQAESDHPKAMGDAHPAGGRRPGIAGLSLIGRERIAECRMRTDDAGVTY